MFQQSEDVALLVGRLFIASMFLPAVKNMAITGGLLFYFASGPGSYSWRRGAPG